MTPEERSHALELSSELLADVELDRIPLDKLLLKGARLARLVDDHEFSHWVSKELTSYGTDDFNGKHWKLTMRGPDKDGATYAGAAHLSVYVGTLEEEFKSVRLPNVSGDYATIAIRETRNHISSIRNAIVKQNQIITAARSLLHEFTSKHFYLLRFSTHQGEMFEAAKANIDGVLSKMPGEALHKIDSAYLNITAGDTESISSAMNSVRRLIDAVADALFPPTEKTRTDGQGNTIKLGDQQRLNRMKAYIDDGVESASRGTRLKRSISDIYARVSSGVHNDVAASEASYLFLSAYVLLGEVSALPAGHSDPE